MRAPEGTPAPDVLHPESAFIGSPGSIGHVQRRTLDLPSDIITLGLIVLTPTHPFNISAEEQQRRAEMLASRLRTLMDIVSARTGEEVTFAEIEEYLQSREITLGRSRWSYILNAHRYTDDVRLVDAISDFFEVPHGFLRGEKELEMVAAELDLVRAMRARKVRTFAARTLGDLSPEALGAITKILDKEAERAGEA